MTIEAVDQVKAISDTDVNNFTSVLNTMLKDGWYMLCQPCINKEEYGVMIYAVILGKKLP